MYNDDEKEEEVTECYVAFPCDADHHDYLQQPTSTTTYGITT